MQNRINKVIGQLIYEKKKFLQSSMIVPRRTRAWSSEESLVAAGESKRSAFVMQSMTQRLPFDWSDLFIIKREAALINEVERKLPNAECRILD